MSTVKLVVGDLTDTSLDHLPCDRYRKTATIRAVQVHSDFTVCAKEGVMFGSAGDWLAIADDDTPEAPHRWIISAADFAKTYVRTPEEEEHP